MLPALIGLSAAVASLVFSAIAPAEAARPNVIGWVEKGKIMPWGATAKFKMDTGALTSSMHAEHIEAFEKEGEDWVRFDIELEDAETGKQLEQRFERRVIRKVKLSGAGGSDHRVTVLMNVCFGDAIFEEEFSLDDRDDLNYPVLIGRRTIEHFGVIDVTRTFTKDPTCDADSKVYDRETLQAISEVGL